MVFNQFKSAREKNRNKYGFFFIEKLIVVNGFQLVCCSLTDK